MNETAQSQERREVLMAARRYRRDGYKVSGPNELAGRPSFLGDFVPDLIAEREDDKVIVEVKRATTVPGSNDIVELAERVAAHPGWRFELIAISGTTQTTLPDMTWGGEDVRRLLDKGFLRPAFVVAYGMIENLVGHVALASPRRNRHPASTGFPALVRDLVVQGIIDEDTRRKIDEARAKRNLIMHDGTVPMPTRGEVEALIKLGRDLQRDMSKADVA